MRIRFECRLTVMAALLTSAATCTLAQTQQTPTTKGWPTLSWSIASPEEQGMESSALAALVDFGTAQEMDSLVVTRHGKIVAEAYYAPFKAGMRHHIYSATKSVVGMLAGIAIQQGKLKDTNQPVLSFFDEAKTANVDNPKKAITVQHLLDMTSGIDWTEPLRDAPPKSMQAMTRTADWPQYVLDQPMAHAPGSPFNYNSGGTHLLSAILSKQTGVGVDNYAAKSVFQPLGITDFRWDKDPQGLAAGGWGLYMQTRDMAKLGYLYLRGGEWDGAQIVPHSWVNRVYAAKVPMDLSPGEDWRYGDLWWTLPARGAYMMVGFHRQIVLVMPKLDVVVATTGRKHYALTQLLDLVERTVKSESAIAPNPTAVALLQRREQEVAIEPLVVASAPEIAQRISGTTYSLDPNPLGVKEMTLHLTKAASYDIVRYAARGSPETRKTTGQVGMNGQFSQRDPNDPGAIISKASWTGPSTLTVEVRKLEDAETERYVLDFNGKKLSINYSNSYGYRAALSGEAASK